MAVEELRAGEEGLPGKLRNGLFAGFHKGQVGRLVDLEEMLEHGSGREGEYAHGDQVDRQVDGVDGTDLARLGFELDLDEEFGRIGQGLVIAYFADQQLRVAVNFLDNKAWQVGVPDEEVDIAMDKMVDFIRDGIVGFEYAPQSGEEFSQGFLENGVEQRLFGLKIIVQQPFVDPGGVGDFLHAGPCKPFGLKDLLRGFEYFLVRCAVTHLGKFSAR